MGRLLFIALIMGTCYSGGISFPLQAPSIQGAAIPPQRNPNILYEYEGHDQRLKNANQKHVIGTLLQPEKIDPTKQSAASGGCDLEGIINSTGASLLEKLSQSSDQCVNGIFSVTGDARMKSACNEAKMITVANAFTKNAQSYDPSNAAKRDPILPQVLFLRGCYYLVAYNEKAIGKYSDNVKNAIRPGIMAFLKQPNLAAKDVNHYQIASETITLISNLYDYLYFIPQLTQAYNTLSAAWKFEPSSGKGQQTNVINAIYDSFFRSHENKDTADAFYAKNLDVANALSNFMDKHGDLLKTGSEWILANTGGELARFTGLKSIQSKVAPLVKKQLGRFTKANATKVWMAIATKVDYYDAANCAQYNLCNFKENFIKEILPFNKDCAKTKLDTFKIRAQSLNSTQADEICKRLNTLENNFHTLMKTNWKPLPNDNNDKIEVIVFHSPSDYQTYASLLFGIATNNGGIYIEGDPTQKDNVARFYCYEKNTWDGKFDVWNLEHEFTHYLDGRYDMAGGFQESSSGPTIWWIEGAAEYNAHRDTYQGAKDTCKYKKVYTLSTLLQNNYNSGTERIYQYGYLAARFMFEKHRADVDTILGYFRAGKYQDYTTWLNKLGTKYDEEFSKWCDQMAGV